MTPGSSPAPGIGSRAAGTSAAATSASASSPTATPTVLTSTDLARTVDRIAHQILERVGDRPLTLLGIPTRGADLAVRLAQRIVTFSGRPCPVGALDITLYRDDLRRRPPRALEETSIPEEGVDGRVCVLVDDVLFSGRTIRAALDALRDIGRPAAVQLAVLIDRGHRELPIRADYVGKNIPTAPADDVAVRLVERDGIDEVQLHRSATTNDTEGGAS